MSARLGASWAGRNARGFGSEARDLWGEPRRPGGEPHRGLIPLRGNEIDRENQETPEPTADASGIRRAGPRGGHRDPSGERARLRRDRGAGRATPRGPCRGFRSAGPRGRHLGPLAPSAQSRREDSTSGPWTVARDSARAARGGGRPIRRRRQSPTGYSRGNQRLTPRRDLGRARPGRSTRPSTTKRLQLRHFVMNSVCEKRIW